LDVAVRSGGGGNSCDNDSAKNLETIALPGTDRIAAAVLATVGEAA
jgi:hypothetical protein